MNKFKTGSGDFYEMTLWPNRSFETKNLKFLLLIVFLGLIIPVLPFLGSMMGTVLLLFSMTTLVTFGSLFLQSYSGGNLKETIRIDQNEISVTRIEADGRKLFWRANSYWAKVKLYPEGQIVQNYLTLTGGSREIELGAYLSPEERTLVSEKIETTLSKIKSNL